MIKHKRLTSKAGITIPKDQRIAAGLMPKMAVDIINTDDGILIRKHIPTCTFCNSIKNVVSSGKNDLCESCIKAFTEQAKQKGLSI